MPKSKLRRLLMWTLWLAAVPLAPCTPAHAVTAAITLYEAFGSGGLFAEQFSSTDQILGSTHVSMNVSNVTAAAGRVYWQSGNEIFSANADLSAPKLLWTNGSAPSGIAFDGAYNILYESFGSLGLFGVQFDSSGQFVGTYRNSAAATNVVSDAGQVVWVSDSLVYKANADLSATVTLWKYNLAPPAGIAYDAADSILYEAIGAEGLDAIQLDSQNQFKQAFFSPVPTSNVVAAGGRAYWQSGALIYVGNADLSGAAVLWQNIFAPTAIAVGVAPVPEPATAALLAAGLGLLMFCRSRQRA